MLLFQLKILRKKKNEQKEVNTPQIELNGLTSQSKVKLEDNRQVNSQENKLGNCSIKEIKNIKLARSLAEETSAGSLVNKDWKKQIEELDSLGAQVNKTLISLVKMYSESEVERAIALLKIRKREKFIPNLAGYFTVALKEGWVHSNITDGSDKGKAIDKASIFRLWYELAKKLGYCTLQEIREGEQWVLISGNWERWEDATKRGYSLDYLKKVIKRNRNN